MATYRTDQERIDAATLEIKNPNVVGSGYIQHPPQKPFAAPLQMQPPTVAHFDFPDEYSRYQKQTGQHAEGRAAPRRAHEQRSQGYAHTNGRPQNGPTPYSYAGGQQSGYRQPHGAPGRPQHQAGVGSMPSRGPPSARPARGPPAPQAQARPAAIPIVPLRAPNQDGHPQRQHTHGVAHNQTAHLPAPAQHPRMPAVLPHQAPHVHAPAAAASHSAPLAEGQSAATLPQGVAQISLNEGNGSQAPAPQPQVHASTAEEDADQGLDKAMSKSQAKRLRKKKREGKV